MDELKRAIQQSQKSAAKKTQRRGANYRPATVTGTRGSALERAKNQELKARYRQIDVQLKKEAHRHKFSTKADLEKKARAEYQAGKIKRGQLQKTIDRRWKAAQKRQEKFKAGQKSKRAQLRDAAKKSVRKLSGQNLGLGDISALVTFRISSDVRQVQLTFPGSAATLRADARDALADYMGSDDGDLMDVSPL